MIPLFRGASTRMTFLAAAVLVVTIIGIGVHSPSLDAAWRVDEGQRIAEAYLWRLLRAGDVTHPDWYRTIAFRSHPQTSKFFYGAVLELSGVPPPRSMELALRYDAGVPADTMPEEHAGEYGPMLRPARLASFVVNVSTAAVIFVALLRFYGFVPALLAQLILFRHYLFGSALFYARSDTVQSFLTTATIVPLLFLPAHSGAAIAAVIAALAFQTRLNGGVALLMCLVFLLVRGWRERETWIAVAILVAVFGIVSVAVNPYYWGEPRPAGDLPAALLVHEALPLRVLYRLQLQVAELRQLLSGLPAESHLPSIAGRIAFTARVLFSGAAGVMIALGLVLAIVARPRDGRDRATLAWAVTGIGVIAVWLPVRWDSHLLLIVPPAVIAASIGYAAVARRVVAFRLRQDAAAEV